MDEPRSSMAERIAQVAIAFERQRTGHAPSSGRVVLSGDTLVVILHGTLSPAELALATSPAGATRLQEFHRELFTSSSAGLLQEIQCITGAEVREAAAEVEGTAGTVVRMFSSGTMVQVYALAHPVPPDTWSGSGPDHSF